MRLRLTETGRTRHGDVVGRLRESYDAGAAARDAGRKGAWKLAERAAFLDRLRATESRTLLEVGAGTGQDSVYFQTAGLDVTAVDLSPQMVARTQAKGIPAHVRDVLDLGFPDSSFDALYSLNMLLHVPNPDLPAALRSLAAVLKPGGLFFLGVFGGAAEEGVAEEDQHVPPRFFSFRTDEQLLTYAAEQFEILDFHVVEVTDDIRFQSLTLVRPFVS